MKINSFFLLLLLLCPFRIYSQGIRFESGSFQEILRKAQQEKKMIFIDVYTSWCGPCKMMAEKVFTDPQASQFYNSHFLCYQVDAEKGEGPEMVEQLQVNCYPTFLYLTPEQVIRHRFSGAVDPKEFICQGRTALGTHNNLATLEQKYIQGTHTPEFLLKYMQVLKQAYRPYNQVADEFFDHLSPQQILLPTYKNILEEHLVSTHNRAYRYILGQINKFNEEDRGLFIGLIDRCFRNNITAALRQNDITDYRQCYQELAGSSYPEKDRLLLWAEKEYFQAKEDWESYFEQAVIYLELYASDNWIDTWQFARQFADGSVPFQADIAIPYAARAVKLMPNYSTYITYARILYKTGNATYKQEIIDYIHLAIQYEIDHQTGRDLSPENEFLEQAKQMEFLCHPFPSRVITIQPIVSRADDGTSPASMSLPREAINRVYARTGIEFYFLPPIYWNNSQVKDGQLNLDSICCLATEARIFKGSNDLINMVFVDRIDGKGGPQGRGLQNGNIIFITLGQNNDSRNLKELQAFVIAHELGHNFGLQHAVDDIQVPDSFPNIMGDGAFSQRIDPRYSLNPYQLEVVKRSPFVRQRVDFLSLAEGRKAILDETFESYFSQLQRREIMAFTGVEKIPDELDSARNFLRHTFQNAVLEFTDQERRLLTQVINKVTSVLMNHQLTLMAEHPWRFIKIKGDICGGFAHTRGNCIILSEKHLRFLQEYSDDLPLLTARLGKLIVHEQMHVLQRVYQDKFVKLNTEYWPFIAATLQSSADMIVNQVSNPDAPHANWLFRTNRGTYYWPRILFNEKVNFPQMGKDFIEYAYSVENKKGKFQLYSPRRSHRILLSEFTEYTQAFPVKTGIDHPNEISAYMFADYFEALLLEKKPFSSIAATAQTNTRHFLEWCHEEMGDKHKKSSLLMSRLTLRDKIRMLSGDRLFNIKGFPELGIPEITMTDGPQGIRDHGRATAFPAPICMAATWNPALIHSTGAAIAGEGKAKGIDVLLAPGVNMYRVPQCGRNFEYMGEDPCLASRIAVGYIQGVQSQGMIATVKHFVANNQDFDRHRYSSDIDERTLHEIYFPVFKAAVCEGKVQAVMTSYNPLNGVHTCESEWLLKDVLRKQWGFEGITMSDWISVYSPKVLKAGLDLEMPSGQFLNADTLLLLLRQKQISLSLIDEKVDHIISTCMRMHLYDNRSTPPEIPFASHDSLACQVATEGIVLLKNEELLPLQSSRKQIAVITPQTLPYSGGGAAQVQPETLPSLYRRLEEEAGADIHFTPIDISEGYDTLLLRGIDHYDAVIVTLGFNDRLEGEGFDRPFYLPAEQNDFMQCLCRQHPWVVAILTAGGGVEIPWIDQVEALLYSWYPGQAGDKALANLLLGKNNPSGKLPISIEKRWRDNAAFGSYDTTFAQPGAEPLYTLYGKPHTIEHIPYREGIFTGYRHYDTHQISPLFPFGYGLSYSRFTLSCPRISQSELTSGDTLYIRVKIKNTGKCEGQETVQLYLEDVDSSLPRPLHELKAFQKINLKAGESKYVSFQLTEKDFAFYNPTHSQWETEAGHFIIHIGTSSRQLPLQKSFYLKPH